MTRFSHLSQIQKNRVNYNNAWRCLFKTYKSSFFEIKKGESNFVIYSLIIASLNFLFSIFAWKRSSKSHSYFHSHSLLINLNWNDFIIASKQLFVLTFSKYFPSIYSGYFQFHGSHAKIAIHWHGLMKQNVHYIKWFVYCDKADKCAMQHAWYNSIFIHVLITLRNHVKKLQKWK